MKDHLPNDISQKSGSKPEISVIVPIYNSEKYLKKCLDCLINQTLQNIEIILVDDGSPDNSFKIYEEYAKKDNRIVIIKQSNQKQGAARNRGMEIAKGEYIGFVDCDDFVDLNFFEILLKTAKKHFADMAMSSVIKVSSEKTKYKWKIQTEEVFHCDYDKFIKGCQNRNAAPYNKIYKRSFIEKYHIKFPEGVFYEDGPFSIKAVYYANKLVTAPSVYYYYLKNPNSTVNSKQSAKHIKDALDAKKMILGFARKNELNVPVNTFHYTKKIFKFCGISFLSMKENLKRETYYLFKIIPIFWRNLRK